VYVAEFVPTIALFLYHWYEGVVPPFVGVAVKVTEVPAHTGFALAAIETLAGRELFTVIVMMLLVAGLPVTHVALDVITTFTASL
jgi:hypothetical protein